MVAETGRSGPVLRDDGPGDPPPGLGGGRLDGHGRLVGGDPQAADPLSNILDDAVLESLGRLSFQDAMTLIDRVLPVDVHAGRTPDPSEERVRFRSSVRLGFPASDMESIERVPGEPPLIAVNVHFMGLHGSTSPLHYAERIAQQDDDHEALRDFFDFFNHRLISFVRRIWLRWRYHLRYRPGGRDPLSRRLLALAGLPFSAEGDDHKADADIGAGAAEAPILLPELGVLALYARSASAIGTVLTNHFRVSVSIREFVPREVDIPPEVRGRLGLASTTLGRDFIAGSRVRDSLGKYTVRIGPVSMNQFRAFLPGGENHEKLCRLVDLMQTQPLEWDLELKLVDGEATALRLGRSQLGWTGWLGEPPAVVEPVRVTRMQGPH